MYTDNRNDNDKNQSMIYRIEKKNLYVRKWVELSE